VSEVSFAGFGPAQVEVTDTERSLRLERIIIALILLEIDLTGYQLFVR
jgi:hypothetical protein